MVGKLFVAVRACVKWTLLMVWVPGCNCQGVCVCKQAGTKERAVRQSHQNRVA